MESELRSHLVSLAEAYAKAKGLELVTVARQAAGDWRFFDRITADASFTVRKYDATVAWFVSNWPDGLAWPQDVPRPQHEAAA